MFSPSVPHHFALCLSLRWVCQRKWSNAACNNWAWLWTLCTAKTWCIGTSSLRMCFCLTESAAASSWQTLAWHGGWAAVWNGWAAPSPTPHRKCAVPVVLRVSSWPPVWMCGRSACWCFVCWRATSPGKQRCRPTPFTRSFGAGRKRGVPWERTRLSGAASLTMPCACFRGCSPPSQKNAAESRTSSALLSMSW